MRTFGVEEELLLVEEQTGKAVPVAQALLAREALSVNTSAGELTAELQQEMVEAITAPCADLDELRAAIVANRAHADGAARTVGARAVALATSPNVVHPHLMPNSRFAAMHDRFGITARNSLTCGLHVHVSIESPEEGVGALDRIRAWLPLLVALSANSPFAAGEDTGFSSYRSRAWHLWPSTGPNDIFGSSAAYTEHCQMLLDTGVLLDAGMFYFDARLSRNHPTLEVRVSDVCLRPSTSVAIAAICRALVETAVIEWQAGIPAPPVPSAVIKLASLKASQTALSSDLLHPITGMPIPAREAIDLLLASIDSQLEAAGDAAAVHTEVNRLFAEGTGAAEQRSSYAREGNLRDVVLDALRLTHGES